MNTNVTTEKLMSFSKLVPFSLLICYLKLKAGIIPLFHEELQ